MATIESTRSQGEQDQLPPRAHDWQSARFTGTTTCRACRLLPLDQDDIDTECPGG